MRLLHPLGLLALLIIPVLVLVYIIKNKYTEQTVASTYLWALSERFVMRRNPISKLVGIISLILQILAIIAVALAIAHPVFIRKGAAEDYCFVLDASGSMTTIEEGGTRFEIAKDKAAEIIEKAVGGSSYTLIYASDNAYPVFERLTDKSSALLQLDGLAAGYCEDGFDKALSAAQEYFSANTSIRTYLFTDVSYPSSDNVTVVTVGSLKENYAVSGAEYSLSEEALIIKAKAISYLSDASVTAELYIDGEERPSQSLSLSLTGGEEQEFSFKADIVNFSSLRVAIAEKDSQPLDNGQILYNLAYVNAEQTLLISDNPAIYLKAALLSAGMAEVKTVSSKQFNNTSGYGLYIFDNVLPESLPDDGAVWFINPKGSVAGANFSYQGTAEAKFAASYSTSTSTAVKKLLKGVTPRQFELVRYSKCGLNGSFTTLISCEGNPLAFAGVNAYGNREAVFAFDLKDAAAFTLSDSFVTLVHNLLEYSFPSVVEGASYYSGDSVFINVIPGADSVVITTPLGKEVYLDASVDAVEYQLTEVGTYTIAINVKNKYLRTVNLYSALPEYERTSAVEGRFEIIGEATPSVRNGQFDSVLIILIALLVLIVADYGVYCYEQYQLR